MSSLLQQLDIFELRPLITNINCKLSAVSAYDARKQLLCLVSEENDIVLRFTSDSGQEVLKLISWFRRTHRVIHDVCFDPTGSWLLVLCFDNTLHIVPALAVVSRNAAEATQLFQQQPYSTTQVTSYIIPFVGPHECPNSKKCPNHIIDRDTNKAAAAANKTATATASATASAAAAANTSAVNQSSDIKDAPNTTTAEENEELPALSTFSEELSERGVEQIVEGLVKVVVDETIENEAGTVAPSNTETEEGNLEVFSHDVPQNMLASATPPHTCEDKTGNSQVMASSFMASQTCPYPLSVVWWQTIDGVNRAIIGYSDGSICFVGLSPNCPFVASTAIETGSVVKLLICKDITFQSVMLLITSSLKQQFKLLLEQKAIKYIYPGDISPTTSQSRENDWQIVMPLKSSSNHSDPASDNSQLEEDVFVKPEEMPPLASAAASVSLSVTKPTVNTIGSLGYVNTSHLPPPPPYSVAISRCVDSASVTTAASNSGTTTTTGARMQHQPLDDDLNGRAGILPAARARLASLKSLGSKKLNAIKMRLSDNRQKLEEYIPENTLGSFAIMDSPSLTPEMLSNSFGSFYTIQNLRSTYLLSALHSQTNSLSVHSIDINLKPLFLYKIPKNCFDILIGSNLLYSIQYVDSFPQGANAREANTEKENRDVDAEKEEEYTKERMNEMLAMSDNDDKFMRDICVDSFDNTSATTSGPSTSTCPTPNNSVNAVAVISSAMASLRTSESDKFNMSAQLGVFRFEHETVLSLYQMATYRTIDSHEAMSKDEKSKAYEYKGIRTPMDYVQFYDHAEDCEEYSLREMEIMQNEFPKVTYDPCYVVTNKNVYYVQLKKEPFALFLDAALAGEWVQCREFCNTFDLTYEACIEFAGDYLLRRKKITQALLTYNNARIKPIRTALKLAMFGQTNALMHLCAMALKCTYILKSQYFCHPIIKTLMDDITYRTSEDVRPILPPNPWSHWSKGVVNEGARCGNYCYGIDESISSLQMSPSSQFHLANLLLITLAEKAVNDKNYVPLWNFLVTNSKYHTNMTSIVLCQSGLFSAALILAKARGVCMDTFLALTSVAGQEFGWYTELNVCLYNLSEPLFMEIITYMPQISLDYFNFIQEKLEQIRPVVLKRLEHQLNPFSATLRPIVSHTSSGRIEFNTNDNNVYLFEFCKNLIETYLAILIHMESQGSKRECIANALSTFRITYEDNQFAIESSKFKPISAGCAHCACVVDGIAYFWGSNGVPCNYSVNKSSDPPEPPHAVKSLDLLSQLNLEVHAVKCGRQHTLILTNNGLYSFGNNNLSQLGIGKDMYVALHPVLVKKFDGKDITILEAGQYHNAAVADGLLYTWGWGIYGQLGHGNTENASEPEVVAFFKHKKVMQVSLGHAHSLVLCRGTTTELYVFGSNHFGQLGIGLVKGSFDGLHGAPDDEASCASQVKSLVPLKLDVSTANIRLIHTKFFTNLAVDENERMYTWGSSPQALRLANQIKRRANARQKIEEHQRREMSKRFETITGTVTANVSAAETVSNLPSLADTQRAKSKILEDAPESEVITEVLRAPPSYVEPKSTNASQATSTVIVNVAAAPLNEEEMIDDVEDLLSLPNPKGRLPPEREDQEPVVETENKSTNTQQYQQPAPEADGCEHMAPQLVDTSEVAGQILQISSGLFHFALISSSCTLYTWGKNLEHQLGTEDKDRRAVNKPSPIDSIERPMYVDCGADFTLVMTTDFVVKAFGGNSNGQCGRDLGPSLDKIKQRVVCLPTTKRLMRFESQCIDAPVEINLPRPCIRLDMEPIRYLKSIPKYQQSFIQAVDINFDDINLEQPSLSQNYKSTTQGESSENVITGQESDDPISSLENYSNNDVSSLNPSVNQSPVAATDKEEEDEEEETDNHEITPDEPHYTPLNATENVDQSLAAEQGLLGAAETAANSESTLASERDTTEQQELRKYIHYCLYVFHGLYNPDKVRDFSQERLEYRIRTLMLNFKFVDAFTLCLEDCNTARKALKIFEYFTKDTGYVPMRRQDLKFLIYQLMLHFLARKFDLLECERFFLADLDYYLLELAYVLYFNNNNTLLEQNLNQKFKELIAQDDSNQNDQQQAHKLEDTDVIFDSLSVKFKTIICQRLLKHCGN